MRLTTNTVEDKAIGSVNTSTMDFPEESMKLIHGSCENYTMPVPSSDESALQVSIPEERSRNRKVVTIL